jgi:(p)ppGpp synthase/HD superfamily hydrolase
MNDNHPLIKQCLDIAEKAHFGQVDKAGENYLLHPLIVSLLVQSHQRSVLKRPGSQLSEKQLLEARCVALLHDVVEDSAITVNDLKDHHHLPVEICDAVKILTKTKGEDYDAYLIRVKANPLSRLVKLADLLDNSNLNRLTKITHEDIDRRLKYLKAMIVLWQD